MRTVIHDIDAPQIERIGHPGSTRRLSRAVLPDGDIGIIDPHVQPRDGGEQPHIDRSDDSFPKLLRCDRPADPAERQVVP